MKESPSKKKLKDYEQAHLTWNKGRYGKYKILKKLSNNDH